MVRFYRRKKSAALPRRHSFREREDILQEERHAAKSAVRCLVRRGDARADVIFKDDRVEFRVHLVGTRDGQFDQLGGFDLLFGYQLGESDAVMCRVFFEIHFSCAPVFTSQR